MHSMTSWTYTLWRMRMDADAALSRSCGCCCCNLSSTCCSAAAMQPECSLRGVACRVLGKALHAARTKSAPWGKGGLE